ncbi:5-methylcytosine restriction system specificity protein McrC [Butyrivibrio sp. WCE2006]|uniref:5-methylcytosine restriction system specificity protein McrC n=1 Tax=Butyrivibrio sp. WCE2006 TaxID=1410611 RepID=UPI0005D182A5|nr:hypothetical protein [Butyrivibrio sp. WCE2006]
MGKIFLQMPCLSESKTYTDRQIHEELFDKKSDYRYLESSIQTFLDINIDVFDFAGIHAEVNGSGKSISIKFISGGYVGAVPVRMPYDGVSRKDIQIFPRFENQKDNYSELFKILDKIDYSDELEYMNNRYLNLPFQLKPPIYNEAMEYIRLFEEASRYRWRKFENIKNMLNIPSGGTDWNEYARNSYDPKKRLEYPSKRNVLSINHKEWQELVYVLELACEILNDQAVPVDIRLGYQRYFKTVIYNARNIKPEPVKEISFHAKDPDCIKRLKKQAVIILHKNSTTCAAWRMDMSKIFERYVQYLLKKSTEELAGREYNNPKIHARGDRMRWGLKYLEPDMVSVINNGIVFEDAKYKSHLYSYNSDSELLKETFRSDLHQIVAYCAFEPADNKKGVLFYPAAEFRKYETLFETPLSSANVRIFLCGIPFCDEAEEETIVKLKEIMA